jgi:diguanylate cyclase (GGDEF)-like protein
MGPVALSVLFGCGGLVGLFIGIAPPPGVAPGPSILSSSIAILLSVGVWRRRHRFSARTVHVATLFGLVAVPFGAYQGRGTFSGDVSPYFFFWLALIAFVVFSLRMASLYVAAAAAAYAVVLVLSHEPNALPRWVVVVSTMAAAGFVVGVLRQRLHAIAVRDPLTTLLNRHSLGAALKTAIRDAHHHRSSTVAMLDLNDFKAINDEHGHQRGDDLLVEVATALRAHLRAQDIVIRYGGDEFFLLLRETDLHGADQILSRLALPTRCAVGMTTAHEGDTPTSLFNRVDTELYRAKAQSRVRTGKSVSRRVTTSGCPTSP